MLQIYVNSAYYIVFIHLYNTIELLPGAEKELLIHVWIVLNKLGHNYRQLHFLIDLLLPEQVAYLANGGRQKRLHATYLSRHLRLLSSFYLLGTRRLLNLEGRCVGDTKKEVGQRYRLALVTKEETQLGEASTEFHLDPHLQNGILVEDASIGNHQISEPGL